jgi:sphinganine-1-phosphate aldolase
LRKYQYFITPTWTGGIYATPTISGSRPGALVATCWSALLHFGQDGYIESTRQILQSVEIIKKGVQEIDGIELMGEGLAMVVAVQSSSPKIDIFMVMDAMKQKGWECNAILYPSGFHFCVTQLHVGDVAHQFVKDLKESVEEVKKSPEKFAKGLAPIYSQAVRIPDKTPIKDFVAAYFDKVLDL